MTSVPRVRQRRPGWFWCGTCGKEEQIFAGAPEGYVPNLCVACGKIASAKRGTAMQDIMRQVREIIPLADRELQERKIAANEGRIDPEHVEQFRKAIDNMAQIANDAERTTERDK